MVRIVWEHNGVNLAEVERMKKILNEKEVPLVKQAINVKWWMKTMVQITWEHNEVNLAKVERMKKKLDEKEVPLIK